MYYIKENDKITLADEDLERLKNTLLFKPELSEADIVECEEGYTVYNFELMTESEKEAAVEAEEQERINMLYLTAADVERAIYKAKGMDFNDIIALVEAQQPEGLDVKSLKIELKANNFYRGNPYINTIGTLLGFTSDMLNKFFETNDYKELIAEEEKNASTTDTAE